ISSENIDFHTNEKRDLSPPFRLLYVGRLSQEKGIAYLLRAIASIDSRSMFHLDIVGDGDLMGKLVEDTRKLRIHNNVTFHGYIPQGQKLLNIYRGSDVLILPALQDQQPKVLMEAMSQGLPVVATEVGGIPSIITHGKNGLLIPPAQPAALISAIQRLLITEERIPIIQRGLAYVRDRTVDIETDKMMKVVMDYIKK
ncbi:MAG: glycosyltransferase family 4 protein, partial [Candidatus Kariarchaeaceae archaeon]